MASNKFHGFCHVGYCFSTSGHLKALDSKNQAVRPKGCVKKKQQIIHNKRLTPTPLSTLAEVNDIQTKNFFILI